MNWVLDNLDVVHKTSSEGYDVRWQLTQTPWSIVNLAADSTPSELHFLLLAPLTRPRTALVGPQGPQNAFVDRHTTREVSLNQSWETLDAQAKWATIGPLPSKVVKAARVCVRGQDILALEAKVSCHDKAALPSNASIERTLTIAAQDFLEGDESGSEAPWVGRYQLLRDGEEVLPDWLDEEHTEHRLSTSTPAVLQVGWGNGSIAGWGSLSEVDQAQVVRGLVDAQCIWFEADLIAHGTILLMRSLGAVGDRVTSGDLRQAQRTLDGLHYTFTEHHVAYDDVALNLQGPRRAAAESALSSWGYRDLSERIGRRIDDCKEVIILRQSRRERRYQSTVETILFLLGLITFVDVVLNLVATAFSENSEGMPGERSSIGMLRAIRSVDSDILLLSTLTLALMIFLLVERGRRRWGLR